GRRPTEKSLHSLGNGVGDDGICLCGPYVDGGITVQGFLRAGLIQRLIITRVPVLIGEGIPWFRASTLWQGESRRSAVGTWRLGLELVVPAPLEDPARDEEDEGRDPQ